MYPSSVSRHVRGMSFLAPIDLILYLMSLWHSWSQGAGNRGTCAWNPLEMSGDTVAGCWMMLDGCWPATQLYVLVLLSALFVFNAADQRHYLEA